MEYALRPNQGPRGGAAYGVTCSSNVELMDIPLEPIGSGDKPPPYKKVAGGTHPAVADYEIPDGWKDTRRLYLDGGEVDKQTGLSTFDGSLSQDPEALFRFVSHQMKLPPRVHVHVKGSQRAGDSWEKKFHFKLDVTDTVLRPTNEEDGWYEPQIVCDGDGQEVYRGDCVPSVEWKRYVSRKTYERSRDLESGYGESVNGSLLREDEGESRESDNNPGLMGWCERFCNHTGGAKSFTISREIKGLDLKTLRRELISYSDSMMSDHGRDSKVDIDCHIHWNFVTVYSPHWVNRLRKNRFVWWFCVLTQLWIITAPVIAILERVYEVINPVWWYSHETENATSSSGSDREYSNGRDEAKVADFWAPMMIQAASFRLNEGELLNLDDMERIQRRHREREENLRSSRSEAF